jgi:hypothetical protein
MKLLILGATGDVGSAVTREAQLRNHDVTAAARNKARLEALGDTVTARLLDVSQCDADLDELFGSHDAIISALRPPSGREPLLVSMTKRILESARNTGQPVYITGGAGPLKLGGETAHTVLTAPDFLPDRVRPIAEACGEQNTLLDDFPDTDWVCLRPPAMLLKGKRTGRYGLGRDTLVKQADGQSSISFADFAVAMLDLVELHPAAGQRLTVGW